MTLWPNDPPGLLDKRFACTLTIQGDGRGKYGKPKVTKIGPMRNFMTDNIVYYVEITKHLQTCDVCSIDEILKEYLRRRVEIPKFGGETSKALMERAVVLERLAIKRGQFLTPGLVNELIWRSGPFGVKEYGSRLSLREKYLAFNMKQMTVYSSPKSAGLQPEDELLAEIAASMPFDHTLTSEDLYEMLAVAEVMVK